MSEVCHLNLPFILRVYDLSFGNLHDVIYKSVVMLVTSLGCLHPVAYRLDRPPRGTAGPTTLASTLNLPSHLLYHTAPLHQ